MYEIRDGRLVFGFGKERVYVEPWGRDSLRVRAAWDGELRENAIGALTTCEKTEPVIEIGEGTASLTNGKIKAVFRGAGLTFYNDRGEELTGERWRGAPLQRPLPKHDPMVYPARAFRPLTGGGWRLEWRVNAYEGEKLFGMGQYQDGILNWKGATLELKPRNKQASIPFVLSSRGYGLLWNNPAIGRVSFGENYTQWEAEATDGLDIWITAGDTPRQIERNYVDATGHSPMMPEYGMGFWQCKLRYVTQDELMTVAREYKRLGVKLSVIIIDFFHWTKLGNWYLDPACWPDPEGMCKELEDMGVKLAVSVWPTVEAASDNYAEMREKGMLVETVGGLPYAMDFGDRISFSDMTNPETRSFIFDKLKKNYLDKGVTMFWADAAEPEYSSPDMDMYIYKAGPATKVGNAYARDYARMLYEGEREYGIEAPMSLIRCAWAGSQKYGALLWSGDIYSTWQAFREQVVIGQNVGLAGLPWWNTDIGGFSDGKLGDPAFTELLLRWFEWATYCPVMRLHGIREGEAEKGFTPHNEIWSYGPEAYEIMKAHIERREALRPYIRQIMAEAHEHGDPAIRALFYEFPDDPRAWETPFEYMFGPDLLVCPVLEPGVTEIRAYLPAGASWRDERDGKTYEGGREYTLAAPIESIPVLKRV